MKIVGRKTEVGIAAKKPLVAVVTKEVLGPPVEEGFLEEEEPKTKPGSLDPFSVRGFDKVNKYGDVQKMIANGLTTNMVAFLGSEGLPQSQKPGEEPPAFPEDVSMIDNTELGRLHGQFTLWTSYVEDLLSVAKARRAEIEIVRDRFGAEVRKETSGNAVQKADERDTHPIYALFMKRYVEETARVDLLEAQFNKYDRFAAALSRQMTLRSADGRHHG